MQPLKLAVATRCLKLPLSEIPRGVAELQVPGLQLDVRDELPSTALTDSGRRDFLHRLRERGLEVASTWVPLRHPIHSDIEMERRIAFLKEAMRFSWQLGARTLCVRCGRVPETVDKGPGKTYLEVVSDLVAHGNHVGVTLAMTPTLESAEELAAFVPQVKSGLLGIDFDPAHFAMLGLSATESLRKLHPHVVHVQLRDGVRDFAGGGTETPLGQGSIDWTELVALLGEMDYRGWATAIRTQGDDRAGDIARGLAQMKRSMFLV